MNSVNTEILSVPRTDGGRKWPASKTVNAVEPHSTDTRLIRTPGYCGQFRLS